MAIVTLRYWAAAKEAAGLAEETVEADTLAAAIAAGLEAAHSRPGDRADRLKLVMARSSYLVNGEPAGQRAPEAVVLPEDALVEVLPPFAGG